MKPNYKKIIKVDLPKQLFICSSLSQRNDFKFKYCVEFKDIQNKEMILEAIKHLDKHYVQILSDTKEELYQSIVRIVKEAEMHENKPKKAIYTHNTKLFCEKHKLRIDKKVVKYLESQKKEFLNDLFSKYMSKGKILEISPKYNKDNHTVLSSRLTMLGRKEKKLKFKLSDMVYLYNIELIKKYGII
jgi:hypothetical protein